MRYVTDHFTLDMIRDPSYTLNPKSIKKQEFKKNIKNAKSSITSKSIANMLHKPIDKIPLDLKKGDEVYVVTSDFGRKHSCEYTYNNEFRFEVVIIS